MKLELNKILKIINIKQNAKNLTQTSFIGITKDSREVKDGYIFCAVSNDSIDGHKFLESAKENGASLIISEKNPYNYDNVITVEDSAEAFALLSSQIYDNPSRTLNIAGITGTNGKTTTTYILESIFKNAQYNPGIIGTVNFRFNNETLPAVNTTPQANHFNEVLRKMADAGVTHVFPEISSHGLSLKRVWGIDLDTAIFTNLSQDHLDFHKDFENYYQAKKLMFSELLDKSIKNNKRAIINIDDEYGARLHKELTEVNPNFTIHSISLKDQKADFSTSNLKASLYGASFTINTPNESFEVETPLIGYHNAMNILTAICCAYLYGINYEVIQTSVKNIQTIPGRLDKVQTSSQKHIFVDYAHTPDALENVLKALKAVATNKIITVVGCGGDRDRTKRPLMGEIAAKGSDIVIVTSDNPRTEDPEQILDDIMPGVERVTKDYIRITDRKTAIEKSIDLAEKEDIVLIAGKGHEDYQILGKTKIHFSDKEVVENYLNEPK